MNGRVALVLAALALTACSNSSGPVPAAPGPAPAADALPANGAFIGRAWVSTQRGHPQGSMIVFLPDHSLIMDSCFEAYRISEWGVAGDNIRWREDTIPIEASITMSHPNELTLQIVGQEGRHTYMAASVPYVCPEMPR